MNNKIGSDDPMEEYYRIKEELSLQYPTMRELGAAIRKFAKENPLPPATPKRKMLDDFPVSANDNSEPLLPAKHRGRTPTSKIALPVRRPKTAKPKPTTSFRRPSKGSKSGSN